MSTVAAPVLARRARVDASDRDLASSIALLGTCVLIIVAPFEALQPLLRVPGQSLSTVEVVLLGALGAWAATALWARTRLVWRTPLTAPWIALVVALFIAAVFAPAHRGNALGMVGRSMLALAVYLLTVNAVDSAARLRTTLVAAAAAGAILWPLIALEYAGAPPVAFLTAFRTHAASVGGSVRASGPFAYPTIASMYLEIIFALLLGLLVTWLRELKIGAALAVGVVLVATGQAILLTYTRAGLLAIAAASTIVGYVSWRRRCVSGMLAVATIVSLLAIQLPITRSFESIGLRLTTEGQNSWYRATFDVPVDVSIAAGGIATIPVNVTNTGRTTWESSGSGRYRLSYHWLASDNKVVSWQGLRTDFPTPVPPGATAALSVRVEAPMKAGEYRVMWDVEREHWLWFSTEPGAIMFVSRAKVTGPDVGPLGDVSQVSLPQSTPRPGRLTLWRAALRMFADHPVTGVGPDNYRLMYGEYIGLGSFDTRVHTNNMYLELLVGAGLLGAAAFGWLCWRTFRTFVAGADASLSTGFLGAGVLAAGAAIAIHGLVDSFISFTATYILFAVTLGLASACSAIDRAHAHRV